MKTPTALPHHCARGSRSLPCFSRARPPASVRPDRKSLAQGGNRIQSNRAECRNEAREGGHRNQQRCDGSVREWVKRAHTIDKTVETAIERERGCRSGDRAERSQHQTLTQNVGENSS